MFSRTQVLVLDEADRLLDISFSESLRNILLNVPHQRQTLLFSATMTESLIALQKRKMEKAFVYQEYQGLSTDANLKEEYVFVPRRVKEVYLYYLLS